MEGLAHRVLDLLHVLDQAAVFGDRLGNADDVGLLEGITAHHRAGHLPGDRDYWGVVHVRCGEAGDQVSGARTGCGDTNARSSGGPGVAVGRMRRRLLVAHQHMAKAGKLGQRVVKRHDRAAGIPEECVHALFDQRPAEDLGASQRFCHEKQSRVKGLGVYVRGHRSV